MRKNDIVRLYVKSDCPLCDTAGDMLRGAGMVVRPIDVDGDPVLHQLYGPHIPVADFGNDVRLYWPFTAADVGATRGRASDDGIGRSTNRTAVSGAFTRRLVTTVDRAVYHFARHWVLFIGVIAGLYAGLPLLGPVLMAAGVTRPANLIYTVYRLFCHQLPSRSLFLFGQQICYCDRCLGIYTTLFVAVLAFGLLRARVKPLPWQLYIAFAAPMAADGLTQLLGLRTSTLELRLITGALFGLGSAWLALPYLERGFRDVLDTLNRKAQLAA
jgi:uncharacterized membrane protein